MLNSLVPQSAKPLPQLGLNASVKLFLFSPKEIPDIGRRPFQYAFGGITNEISKRIDTADQLRCWNSARANMTDAENAAKSILPLSRAEPVRLSVFSEYWSFFLIITTVRNMSPNPNSSIVNKIDFEMYSGYVLGEPVNIVVSNFGHGEQTNPNALLVTTHYTCANCGSDNRFMLKNDVDLFVPQCMYQVSGVKQDIANLRPDQIAQGIIPADFFSDKIVPTPSTLAQNDATVQQIETWCNCPTLHLARIVDAIGKGESDNPLPRCNDMELGTTNFNNTAAAVGNHTCIVAGTMSGELKPAWIDSYGSTIRPDTGSVISPNKSFTIGDLEMLYPNIQIQPVRLNANLQFDVCDPMSPTATNQMSSLISTCLPPILLNHGFCDLCVRYNSVECARPYVPGVYQVFSANLLYTTTEDNLKVKITELMDDIIKNVFNVIVQVAGNLDVNIKCSVMGETLVDLTLLDSMNEYQNGQFVINNSLGGFNSSLVGNNAVATNNINQLGAVLSTCANTKLVSPPPSDIGMYGIR